MRKRRFGRTGLEMPVFSCGGMRYQFKWQDQPIEQIPKENQHNLEATIERALELGITHIETARGYGSSERQLGLILPRFPRDELIVQTKIAPTLDPREFLAHFAESLDRLRLTHVDLLALHGVNTPELLDWAIRKGGCFDAAQELRRQGKVRFVGLSSHAPLDTILEAVRFGEAKVGQGFDYINLHWYFILQQNWPAIAEASARDMGVFIISPSDKGGKLYAPPRKLSELSKPLSPMVFNDLFCLARKEVHTLSIGAARPSDFDEHLKALLLLDDAEAVLAPIIERLAGAMQAATGFSDPEAIMTGLPGPGHAPAGLNLPVMLWLRNLALGWDMVEFGKARFNMLGNSSHWFPGAKPSAYNTVKEAELAQAVAASPHAAQIPALLAESLQLLEGAPQKRLSQRDD